VANKKDQSSALNELRGVEQPKHMSEQGAEKLKKLRKNSPSVADLIQGVLQGDKSFLSRAITIMES
jgi:LAO/AO transport system kinase